MVRLPTTVQISTFLNSGSKVEVKSSWPGCIGLHTCYKGENKE